MKIVATLVLGVLLAFVYQAKAYAFDEYINDIPVPFEVTMNIQGVYQGYIIYSISRSGNGYIAVLARDDEPHQYPIRYVTFNKDFNIVKDSGYQNPAPKVEPKKEEPKKEEVKPEPEKPKEEKPKEEKPKEEPPKEEPPVVTPPQEPPVTKPPDPTPTPDPPPEPVATSP